MGITVQAFNLSDISPAVFSFCLILSFQYPVTDSFHKAAFVLGELGQGLFITVLFPSINLLFFFPASFVIGKDPAPLTLVHFISRKTAKAEPWNL